MALGIGKQRAVTVGVTLLTLALIKRFAPLSIKKNF